MRNPSQEALKRFQELLPFYVNETINENDRTFVESILSDYPDAQKQLKFERHLISAMHSPVPERSADAGLSQLLDAWQIQAIQKPSLIQRLRTVFDNWGLSPAFAVAAVLVVVQSAIIVNLQHNHHAISDAVPDESFRAISAVEASKQIFKLSIAPNAEYAQLIQLLQDQGCRIQDGPTASGALFVACPVGEALQQQLQASPLVDDVLLEKAE